MIYRAFLDNEERQVAEIKDANWPLIVKDDKLGVLVDGRESLYVVTEVGPPQMDISGLVIDIWIRDLFPNPD